MTLNPLTGKDTRGTTFVRFEDCGPIIHPFEQNIMDILNDRSTK
jgi:hypothetical protein